MMTIVSFDEFAALQNCEHIQDRSSISRETGDSSPVFIFANGAKSQGMYHYPPPADPAELLQMKIRFTKAKLNREILSFDQYQQHVLTMGAMHRQFPNLPPPPPDAPTQLLAGRERIRVLRFRLRELEAQQPKSAAERLVAAERGNNSESIERTNALIREVAHINYDE